MNVFKLGPAFACVCVAGAISTLGNALQRIAVAWWILDSTESAALTGLWIALTTLPMVLVSPLAGRMADRTDRLKIMGIADLAGGVLAIGLLVLFGSGVGSRLVWLLLVETGLAVAAAFMTPASMALTPRLVPAEQIQKANSAMTVGQQTAGLIGPVLGGLLVASTGVKGALICNAASFGLSVVLLAIASRFVSAPEIPATDDAEAEMAATNERFRLQDFPEVRRMLFAFAAANVCIAGVPVLVPVWARLVFHAGPRGLGLLEGALGAGVLLGAWWMGVLERPIEAPRGWSARMLVAIAVSHALVFAGGAAGTRIPGFRPYVVSLVLLGGFGVLLGALNTVVVSSFQRLVPDRFRGAFMGLLIATVTGPVPLSQAAAGWLAGQAHRDLFVLMMAIWLGATGLWLGWPRQERVTSR